MWNDLLWGGFRTIQIAGLAWVIGLPLAILLAWLSMSTVFARGSTYLASIALSVIPFLAVLFWVHYPVQTTLGVVWDPFFTTTLLLGGFVAVQCGEILSSNLRAVEQDLVEPAIVLSLPRSLFVFRILWPAAVYQSLPRILTLAVLSVHLTMFASLIGVDELFRVTQRLNSAHLRPVPLYSAMAAVYALICAPLYAAAIVIERRRQGRDA